MAPLSLLSVASLCAAGAFAQGGKFNFPAPPKDKSTPVQQRLAYHAPDAVSVGWNTYEHLSMPCVKYGTSESTLNQKACSKSSITYNTSRTWSNFVTLTGLKPGVMYYYKIESTNSTTDFFLSPRTAGDTSAFNASIVVDLGAYGVNGYTTKKRDQIPMIQPELNHTTIGALANTVDDFEFVIHPGDFAYADDWYYNYNNTYTFADEPNVYESIIENFYEQLAPVAGRKPYMTSPGNHEAACLEQSGLDQLCPVGQKNFTDFRNRFGRVSPRPFPSKSKNSTAVALAKKANKLAVPPMWYSFEYGMAHVVMFNTETDFPNSPDKYGAYDLNVGPVAKKGQQLEFLKADLASVDRSVTPWLIVAGHRPWYSTGGFGNLCVACQVAFDTLFYRYGVDLAIFGHVHNSQRFDPMWLNHTDPAGLNNPVYPMYIVAGGAGNIEGLSEVGSNFTGNRWAYADSQSYAKLSFLSKNELGVHFYKSDGNELLDSTTLYKKHDVDFVQNALSRKRL